MNCPMCNESNDDNWPVSINDEIVWGGCQKCWEAECDKSWWEAVEEFEEWWGTI